MKRNLLLTLVAALLAAATAAPANGQKRRANYAELTPEQQAAEVAARVESIVAATAQTREDRDNRWHNATWLWTASTDPQTDERGRKLAFDALVQAYERQPNRVRYGGRLPGGVSLYTIAIAGQPIPPDREPWEIPEGPGLDYVRHVFRTAELPPGPEERAEMGFYESGDLIRSPWCRAGLVLFGGIGGEVNEAYGIPKDEQRELLVNPDSPKPDPPPGKLSDDAAKWWNRCWDGRFSDG